MIIKSLSRSKCRDTLTAMRAGKFTITLTAYYVYAGESGLKPVNFCRLSLSIAMIANQ